MPPRSRPDGTSKARASRWPTAEALNAYSPLSDQFDVLQGDVVRTDAAFVLGQRVAGAYVVGLGHMRCGHLNRTDFGGDSITWLSRQGRFTENGIGQMVARRGRSIGLRVHPHQLRHSWAHAAQVKGMATNDLKMAGGWRSNAMVERYASSTATERSLAIGVPGQRRP